MFVSLSDHSNMSRPGSAGAVLFLPFFGLVFGLIRCGSMARAVGDIGSDHRPGLGLNGD